MKRISIIILAILIVIIGCEITGSLKNAVNTKDNINDNDEVIIKEFRSHHDYTNKELKSLEIKYLGIVDGYRIYYVPFKGSSGVLNPNSWTKEGYTFPVECQTRIIGIKSSKLYTVGNLIHETQINIKQLYDILPEEYKRK
ncbi:hypothetical protein NBE98_10990 [Clostridium swellfunianum]|uniref:hypothetical protein n=1 Tax=Clostridium swellfunianum TaxID=1367462 RepID=UPI00202FADCF|nr:hypothetical protein [Clostridium swellfunianum]MCM0648899.1 hypothetical protein [Clostridium swellfunianum]